MRSPSLSLAPDRSTGAIGTRFAPASEVRGGLKRNVLACIRFGRTPDVGDDPREIPLALECLGSNPKPRRSRAGAEAQPVELWTSDRPADFDRDEGFGFARNGECLFGHLYLLDVELQDLAAATFKAYARVTAFLEHQGYPQLLRCWNFLHDINRGEHDAERYKQFCLGRYQALAGQPGFERRLPAATAIGMHEPGLLIYFLAAKAPGAQIENPRQVPAFQYPRQYGPRSPSFSRATTARLGGADQLFLSGTASVVGHATRHPHDAPAQLEETLANVEALVSHAASLRSDGRGWAPETLRVFVRDPADLPAIRARLEQALGADAPLVYLCGDICRSDLRLEMEGCFRQSLEAGP